MPNELSLAIDVGTGSVRAALMDGRGNIVVVAAREHEQIVPQFGWSEQRPADWWHGVAASIRDVLDKVPDARDRIIAIAACGQMHGTVLVGDKGELVRDTAPLWNDKRTVDYVTAFEAKHRPADYLAHSANPAAPSWPGFKLQWLRDHDAQAFARTAAVLMPKDYINLKLTGEIAMDRNDGGASFLMDPICWGWIANSLHLCAIQLKFWAPSRQKPRVRPVFAKALRSWSAARITRLLCSALVFAVRVSARK
jgi:xylulokinase